ncbi:MAG: hypothetical protein LUG50_13330 [Planctomycetaceae bacterium]|nr:hypothetical protein [Planctomycetaceae bacterium]
MEGSNVPLEKVKIDHFVSINRALIQFWDDWESRFSDEENAIKTGFTELDQILNGGLHKSELTVVAGLPSMGKTIFGMNVAHSVSCSKRSVGLISYRNPWLVIGFMALQSHVDSQKIRCCNLSKAEKIKVTKACEELKNIPLWICQPYGLDFSEVVDQMRLMREKNKVEIFVIDSFELMKISKNDNPHSIQVSSSMRSLRLLSRQLDIPIIAISNLKPHGSSRLPSVSKLYGNTAVQADNILLLYRPEYYVANERPGELEVKVVQNTHGPCGWVNLYFNSQYCKLENFQEC